MPFPFKLSTKFTATKFNDQGKRPRAETIQVDDVVASFAATMGAPIGSSSSSTDAMDCAANHREEKAPDEGFFVTCQQPDRVIAARRKSSLLGVPSMGGEKRSQRDAELFVDGFPSSSSSSSQPQNNLPMTPEQEQRDMVQNIAARVLAMQQPDNVDISDAEIPSGKASFMGTRVPAISFVKYVERLVHNVNRWAHEKPGVDSVGIQSGIFAIEYLERSCAEVSPRSVHRYFLAAFLVGIKYSFDYYLSNTYWAGVGGIRLPELNSLELEFCSQLNWDFAVSPGAFEIQMQKTKAFFL